MSEASEKGRREVATRQAGFAKSFARWLASVNVTPNQISTLSMVFAALSCWCFWKSQEWNWLLIVAVVLIQLRLLCNLFDGMLAIEYKKKSRVGDLYNEVPDRISDAFILLGVGLFSRAHPYAMDLSWTCVFLATMTAYIRVFGAALVKNHYFTGPMAKQHRMFVISVAALLAIFMESALYYSLYVIMAGLVVTNVRRLHFIARDLKEGS